MSIQFFQRYYIYIGYPFCLAKLKFSLASKSSLFQTSMLNATIQTTVYLCRNFLNMIRTDLDTGLFMFEYDSNTNNI